MAVVSTAIGVLLIYNSFAPAYWQAPTEQILGYILSFLVLFLYISFSMLYGQSYVEKKKKAQLTQKPKAPNPPLEEPPQIQRRGAAFPGGEIGLSMFFFTHMIYPESALAANKEGVVYVDFIVHTDGTLSNFEIKKGINPEMDQEALRLVKLLPNWLCSIYDGKPLEVWVSVPVKFKIDLYRQKMAYIS